MARIPSRGDVYWVDFGEGRGREQRGRRPALVVQNDRGNRSSGHTVVAILSTAALPRVYPFTVPYEAGKGGLKRAGHVNCAHLHTIDQSRLEEFAGQFDTDMMSRVGEALRYELDL
jgi:mRNA interferase MazF